MKNCQHYHQECCQCAKCDCCCLKNQDELISSRTYEDAFQKDCFCIMKCKFCNANNNKNCTECDGGFIGCCLLCRGCIC